jgi:Spy/CpxP family protein refolding chaperone
MSFGRKQILIAVMSVLALGAGVVAGMVASRLPRVPASPTPAAAKGDGLSEQLDLSAAQAQQMREIWETVRQQVRTSQSEADKLQRGRDEELVAMLSREQRAKFEKISRSYADRFAELRKQRDQAFATAVDKTRNLLSDEQRRKYDEILKTHVRSDQLGPAGDVGGTTQPRQGN